MKGTILLLILPFLVAASACGSDKSIKNNNDGIFLGRRRVTMTSIKRDHHVIKKRPLSSVINLSVRGGSAAAQTMKKKSATAAGVAQSGGGGGGTASIATSIFNMANNVAGAGILTLPAGKATGTGWIPSIMTCAVLAFCSAHTFILIGRACEMTGETTFKGLWTKAFGPKTAWVVDSMVFTQCFIVSIIYTGLLGDIFSALLSSRSGLSSSSSSLTSRTSVILILATTILWPLNNIRNLASLGFTSILGLVAVLYTVFFIVFRALDGTYSLNPMGKFVAEGIITPPSFDKSTLWNFDLNSLVLMSNLGLAFIAHYNGPSYWRSLEDATSARFAKVALPSYAILAVVYAATMIGGYATFGDACKGNILLNYSSSDVLSTLGRLATGFSLIFGFPLISNGAREGLKNASSALGYSQISDPKNHVKLVTILLIITSTLSIVLQDLKLIAGLAGAVMGSSLVYIIPTLIYSKIVLQHKGKESPEYRMARRNLLFIPFGLFVTLMGVTMTLKNTVFA